MNKLFKNAAAVLGTSLMLISGIPFSASADIGAQEDFVYDVNGDSVTITRYTGDAEELVIPQTIEGKTVTEIGERALEGQPDIVSIEIPSGVTKIGYHAFTSDRGLETITIAASVTEIDEGAFHECEALTALNYEGDETAWSSVTIGESNDALTALTPSYNASLTPQESASDEGEDASSSEETSEDESSAEESSSEEASSEEASSEEASSEEAAAETTSSEDTTTTGTTEESTSSAGTSSAAAAEAASSEAAAPVQQESSYNGGVIVIGVIVGIAVLDIIYWSIKKPAPGTF